MEPSNTVYTMVLRQWDMPKKSGKKSSSYVLRSNWNNVVAANDLKINTVVQIWSFQVADKENLCMALVVVDGGGNKTSGSSNDSEGGSNGSRGSEGVDSNGSSRDAGSTTNQSINMESTP